MVVLVALGGGLAAWLMLRVGLALGPDNGARRAQRARPTAPTSPSSCSCTRPGWPGSGRSPPPFGALVYLWVLRKPGDEQPPEAVACRWIARPASGEPCPTTHPTVLPEPQPRPAPPRVRAGSSPSWPPSSRSCWSLAGGFAAWRSSAAGGPRPAEVLPASTFALVTVDLDPSGGQKVEAIKTLRKFPSWNERTGVSPDSDLVKVLFERAQKDGPCKKLDYDAGREALDRPAGRLRRRAARRTSPRPCSRCRSRTPARRRTPGSATLVKCADAGKDDFGWTLTDDYLVVSDSTEPRRGDRWRPGRRPRSPRTRLTRSGPTRPAAPAS